MYIIEQVKDVINNKNVCINFWSSDLTDDNIFNHIKNGSIKETVKQCLKNSNIIKDDYSSFGVMVYIEKREILSSINGKIEVAEEIISGYPFSIYSIDKIYNFSYMCGSWIVFNTEER